MKKKKMKRLQFLVSVTTPVEVLKKQNGGKKVDVMRPHERTRRPAHPSSPSFHTSPGRGAKGAFPTGPMGDRVHAMAD
jgi:hypothetical protein